MKFQWNKIAGSYPLHRNRHFLIEKKYCLKVALMVKIMPLAIKLLHELGYVTIFNNNYWTDRL